jgi:hypothetical protein
MAEWHTLSARFTDEEYAFLEEFKKRHNLTDNQLLRRGAQALTGLLVMTEAFQSPDAAILKSFADEIQKEMNSPYFKKAMERAYGRWAKQFKKQQITKMDQELSQIQSQLNVFQDKRQRGRPKTKRTRGRPVDTGANQ